MTIWVLPYQNTTTVARKLGVSKPTLILWIRRGLIPRPAVFKVGARRRSYAWSPADILAIQVFIAGRSPAAKKRGRPRLSPEQKVAAAARRKMLRERREVLRAIDWFGRPGNALCLKNYVIWNRYYKLLLKHELVDGLAKRLLPEAVARFIAARS